MKINLHNIYYYFLTCNNEVRKTHITNEFKDFKLVEVNPIMNIGKIKSGATGFSRILDQACIHQDKNKPFQPFAIFEDDVKKFDEFPIEIEIPNDTDILYIGLSNSGMHKSTWCSTVCSRNINDNIIRVYNMLAFHGIIVCSIRGLLTLQKCMFESYFKNTIWDIFTAQIQPYLNVYALKKPLVYQYGKIGGQEKYTKINYIDKADIPIPNEWINKDNLSILTMNHKKSKNFIKIGNSETNTKTIILDKKYSNDTILTFIHNYKDTFDYKFGDNLLTITRTDENSGWGQNLVAYINTSSDNNNNLISKNNLSIFVIACDSYHYLSDVTFHFINENINKKSNLNIYYINETIETKMPNVTNLMTGKITINGKDSFTSRLLKGIKQIKTDYIYLLQDDHWYCKNFLDEVTINTLIEICYKYNLDQLKLAPVSFGQIHYKNYFTDNFEIDKVFGNDSLYVNDKFSINWAFGSDYPMSHNPTIFKKQYLINNLEECIKNNIHTPWEHEIYNFKYKKHIKKYTNDNRNLRIACISKRYENQKEFGIVRHGKITDFGFKIINENRHLDIINLCNINYILKDLGPIEKKIHISWKTKDILELDFTIIKHGIKKLKELNPEYTFEISDNNDVEKFIKKHISDNDYHLIKDRNIVEKVDLWRLLKIYHEGGFYMDIDRLCNIPLKDIIHSEHKCILPMHYDIDFAQDIMISSSKNIIFKEAVDLNLKRRRDGCTDILSLGPITYFHAITKILLGNQIPRYPSKDNLIKLRSIISNCKYLSTFREVPPYNTLIYRGPHISFDKKKFYKYCDVNHWSKNNPNNSDNKPYGK